MLSAVIVAGAGFCQSANPAPAHSSSAPSAAQAADPTVKIELARTFSGCSTLYVSRASGNFEIASSGLDSGKADSASAVDGELVEFVATDSALSKLFERKDATHLLCRLAAGQSVTLTPDDGPGLDDSAPSSDTSPSAFCLQINANHPSQHYRGAIQVTALENGTLRVINSVPLEEYLKGVVGPEIGGTSPLEALKAQAIAARTYTIKNLGKLAFSGADLDDTNRCQNYLGVDAENWRCRTAVEQTAGEVLTYQGRLIDAVYATDCGGMTAQGDEPYLKPVSDPDCAGATPWTVTVATGALQAALAKSGVVGLQNIDYVAVHDRDPSGRAATLTCTDEATGETEDVSATLVRKSLGYDLLRSTLFRVSMTPDAPDVSTAASAKSKSVSSQCSAPATGTVTFIGKGWGHGLGMCQHGAVEMARLDSATDDQILRHFYTGVEIVPLTEGLLESSANSNPSLAAQSAWSPAELASFAADTRKRSVTRLPSVAVHPVTDETRSDLEWSQSADQSTGAVRAVATPQSAEFFPRRGF